MSDTRIDMGSGKQTSPARRVAINRAIRLAQSSAVIRNGMGESIGVICVRTNPGQTVVTVTPRVLVAIRIPSSKR